MFKFFRKIQIGFLHATYHRNLKRAEVARKQQETCGQIDGNKVALRSNGGEMVGDIKESVRRWVRVRQTT